MHARPTPLPAPVISAVRSESRPISYPFIKILYRAYRYWVFYKLPSKVELRFTSTLLELSCPVPGRSPLWVTSKMYVESKLDKPGLDGGAAYNPEGCRRRSASCRVSKLGMI